MVVAAATHLVAPPHVAATINVAIALVARAASVPNSIAVVEHRPPGQPLVWPNARQRLLFTLAGMLYSRHLRY
jgi:hypothetical protein